jgi:23S rRNA pseudouridine1911/1915/1917 synthase
MRYQVTKDFSSFLALETTSTMDLSRFVADNVDFGDRIVAVFARKQTQGRGRRGNVWSQAGVFSSDEPPKTMNMADLRFSESFSEILVSDDDMRPVTFIFPFSRVRIPLDWLTLAVGAAVWDALEGTAVFLANVMPEFLPPSGSENSRFRIKWPNDIIAILRDQGVRKICGILCETTMVGQEIGHIYVGLGLNLFEAPNLEIADSFVSVIQKFSGLSPAALRKLDRHLRAPEFRRALLATFLTKLQQELTEYLCVARTVGQLRTLVLDRSLPKGTWLSVNGGERRGTFDGIDAQARLILAGEPVVAGDIAVLKAPVQNSEDVFARLEKKVKNLQQEALVRRKTDKPESLRAASESVALEPRVLRVALDFGNTRVHWAVPREGEDLLNVDLEYSVFSSSTDRELAKILRPILERLTDRAMRLEFVFCSVNDRTTTRKVLDTIREFLRRMLPHLQVKECEIHSRSVMRLAGLSNKYTEETLGVDRALRFSFAAEKARELGSPVAVMGAGTALTCEAVSAEGEILESLIFPGFQMSLKALHSFTARLPNVAWQPDELEDGEQWNTERSMMRGVAFAESGALLNLVLTRNIRKIYLSGGDAEQLKALIQPLLDRAHVDVEVVLVNALETKRLLGVAERLQQDNGDLFVPESETPEVSVKAFEGLDENQDLRNVVDSLSRSRRKRLQGDVQRDNLDDFRRLGVRLENVGVDRRLDQYLAEKFKFHSREEWKRRILASEVCVQPNAPRVPSESPIPVKWVKHTYRTQVFDQIWFYHPQHHEPDMVERCDVLVDDGDVVVFSKPGNMVIHAVGQYSRNTFLTVANRMGYADAAPIHRIDRETSGILVCARTTENRKIVAEAFRDGTMEKMYLAVTRSNPSLPMRFCVDSPIGDAVNSRIRLKLWVGGANAVSASTHFVKLSDCDGFSLYACFPQTGRTNQIRIHLASVGAWIVGDKMYHDDEEVFLEFYEKGLTERVLKATLFPRHMLHNAAIRGPGGLPEVLSRDPVICPVPADFWAFHPLQDLLDAAGIPKNPADQVEALCRIFDEWVAHSFERVSFS